MANTFAQSVQQLAAQSQLVAADDPLWSVLQLPSSMSTADGQATRAQIATALGAALFKQITQTVPQAKRYVDRVIASGGTIMFDHGAVRTVAWPSGQLPQGQQHFVRFLTALGYTQAGTYPLPRLKMTGRAYAHEDMPDALPQYFVSELHPEQFSEPFQAAVTRVLASSVDPLNAQDLALVETLRTHRALPMAHAVALLPKLFACFARHHAQPQLTDYEILLAESAEMAWISTEGNCFNHATDRVQDVNATAAQERALGEPIKDSVEVSASGRVLQTAYKAEQVQRSFGTDQGAIQRMVPGSFYEFIERRVTPEGRLDLNFDSGNATGIFKMTAAQQASVASM